jgi:hypothetical protein
MIKEKYLDLDLIQKFVKKNKIKEVKIQKEVYSLHFNFIFLLCIGFLGIIIYYKYIEKQRLNKKEAEDSALLEALTKEEEKKKSLEILSKEIRLNPNQVRNAILNDNSNTQREKNENELRKKMNS